MNDLEQFITNAFVKMVQGFLDTDKFFKEHGYIQLLDLDTQIQITIKKVEFQSD